MRCRLGWCTRRALMARWGFLLVPVHMGVCCAGGMPGGVASCCVLCFLCCTCVPLLTVCMLCSFYLYSGLFCATPDACTALCLVLHCTAPLDVSKSHSSCYHPPRTIGSIRSCSALINCAAACSVTQDNRRISQSKMYETASLFTTYACLAPCIQLAICS